MTISANHEPPLGAHLVSPRIGYSHHGLYCGQGKVAHYSGLAHFPKLRQFRLLPRLLRMSRVELVSLENFCSGYGYRIIPHPHARYTENEAIARAMSRLGEHGYAALSNNCEHFVNWALEGKMRSWIIWRMLLILAFALGGIRLLNCYRVPAPPSRGVRRLVRSGLFSLIGAAAMTSLTVSSLREIKGLERRENCFRRIGKIAAVCGLVFGVVLSIAGLRKKDRGWALVGPFVLPPLLGLLGYLAPPRTVPLEKS